MSRDRREEICARLLEIAAGLVGPARAFRNQVTVTAKTEPAIVIWDGDMSTPTDAAIDGASQPVEHRPEIRIHYEAAAASIGTVTNALLLQLIYLLPRDAALLDACSNAGGPSGRGRARIVFEGCGQGLDQGRKIEGELSVNFLFRFRLAADELAP